MPIYEYRCRKCRARFSVFFRSWNSAAETKCPRCGDPATERVMSTFAYHRSMRDVHEASGEPSMQSTPDFYEDPRNIGRWTEKKFKDMGVDVPTEIQEEINAARDGELPDSLTDG